MQILTGYITYVTEMKSYPNNQDAYFNFFFQIDENTTDRCCCFRPELRNQLKELEGRAVTMTFIGEDDDGDKILPNGHNIEIIQGALDFPLKLFNTIQEITEDIRDRKVNVKAEIMDAVDERTNLLTRKGVYMDRQIFSVDDGTQVMALAAWDEAIDDLEVGRMYSFHDITVKMFEGTQNLSTNPYTVISEVDAI